MMRRASILAIAASSVALLTVAAFGAMRWAATSTERPDCPGKIVCPVTGELVCRDKCPTVDPNRPDCPGRIECPQTDEMICVDKCPLGAKAKGQSKSCCGACCEKK